MDPRPGTRIARLLALVVVLAIVAACGSRPISQATASEGPATSAPSGSADPGESPPPGDSGQPVNPSAEPPTSAPVGIPDKPADVTFKLEDREPAGQGTEKVTYRVSWTAPEGVATEFTVIGVTECLRNEKRFDGKPCLVRGMRIPKSVQKPIKTVDGDKRSTTISWKEGEIGLPPYAAILVRASNDAGDSIFTIAWSDRVCWACVY